MCRLGFGTPQPNLRATAGIACISSWAINPVFGEEIAEIKQKFGATLDSGLSAWDGIRQNMNIIGQHVSDNIQNAVNNTIDNVKNTVNQVASTLEQTSNDIADFVDQSMDTIGTTVTNAAKTVSNTVSSTVNKAVDAVGDFFGGLFGGD